MNPQPPQDRHSSREPVGSASTGTHNAGKHRSLPQWLASPAGGHLLKWEQAQCDRWLGDVFGFHALQMGMPALDALRSNRMPKRWLACDVWPESVEAPSLALYADSVALPFPNACLDLMVLPHTLDLCADPHAALREVERVLVPEGRVLLFGFNPTSLWGLGHALGRELPEVSDMIGHWRLRDWLRLLGFEVTLLELGCYRPDMASTRWFDRLAWLERTGARWWPILGSVYAVLATKRVHGMHLLSPAWKTPRARRARAVGAASKTMNRQR
jgi:SAM-dependent methyltransferase